MVVFFNILRLFALFFTSLFTYLFSRNYAIYFFLSKSGPTFIKLGQLLATRPDLIGSDLANIFSSFQDKLPKFSEKKVKQILLKEFGKNWNEIFIDFDLEPTAAASIAQVHKARIKSENVAVKILRPNIEKIFYRDIKTVDFIGFVAGFFSKFSSKFLSNISLLLKEVAKSELDLLQEASNGKRLRHNLKKVEGFHVPRIFEEFSRKNILVIEWVDGISFSNKSAILASKFDKKKIARNLANSYFMQVYNDGFFHADMHNGNLFLKKNGDIAVIDFGICGEIDAATKLAVFEILSGFLNRDYEKVARIHINAGLVPINTNIYDLTSSCRKIGEMIVGSSVKNTSLASLLLSLIKMTKEYQMSTKPELLLLQKTLLLVEGLGSMLDESFNMWEEASLFIRDWTRKNISFDQKIRKVLNDVVSSIKNFFNQNNGCKKKS
jgi:ubiquinone biosynthesis protein